MVVIMLALTSEKVQGVLDDATYFATLCLARDGKRYFFSSIHVDGDPVSVPNKRWSSRKAALQALAVLAQSNHKAKPGQVASFAHETFVMDDFDAVNDSTLNELREALNDPPPDEKDMGPT